MAAAAHHTPGAAQPDLRQQMCWPRSLRELLVSREGMDLMHCWAPVQCPVLSSLTLSFLSLMDLSRLNRMAPALTAGTAVQNLRMLLRPDLMEPEAIRGEQPPA